DKRGYGMGYGVVLDDGSAAGAEENRTTLAGVALNGAFTLWIRRPVEWNGGDGSGGNLRDYANDDVIVLVAEGVAPFTTGTANVFAASNRSVYAIETVLVRGGTTILDQSACSARQGQAGGSSSGGNSAGCIALTGGRQITESLAGSTDLGAGGLK
ncbi:MAG: hypothetical protein ABIP62_03835, partial [Vicinamibacteria bacterium]